MLEGVSFSHGNTTAYLPLIELLHDYFAIEPEDEPRQRREKVAGKVTMLDRSLEETLPYLFGLLGIVDGTDPLAGMDEQIRRRRTHEAVKRILLRESLNQPLMLVFEDLHWIDEETQAFLNLLAEGTANAPVLLLVLTLGTATLLPWGLWPQLALQVVATLSILWNVHALGGLASAATMPVVSGSSLAGPITSAPRCTDRWRASIVRARRSVP